MFLASKPLFWALLIYGHCFWSHAELCIELFSILDDLDLPVPFKYVTVLISYFLDFRLEILILLDTFDAWWLLLDSQVIGLGELKSHLL